MYMFECLPGPVDTDIVLEVAGCGQNWGVWGEPSQHDRCTWPRRGLPGRVTSQMGKDRPHVTTHNTGAHRNEYSPPHNAPNTTPFSDTPTAQKGGQSGQCHTTAIEL